MQLFNLYLAVWLLLSVSSSQNSPLILYDATKQGTPDTQNFGYLTSPVLRADAKQSFSDGATILDTTQVKSESAGYFSKNNFLPNLTRSSGFSLDFTVQILAENHEGSDKNGDGKGDRAGFSVILLGNDRKGIEVGFWTDRIWVQDDGKNLFLQAEGVNFDTTKQLNPYTLLIQGESYTLTNGQTKLLSGKLRDYSQFGYPYNQANFVFLGDNTGSAQAKIKLSKVNLNLMGEAANTRPTAETVNNDLLQKFLAVIRSIFAPFTF
jgi:hypothetical protein